MRWRMRHRFTIQLLHSIFISIFILYFKWLVTSAPKCVSIMVMVAVAVASKKRQTVDGPMPERCDGHTCRRSQAHGRRPLGAPVSSGVAEPSNNDSCSTKAVAAVRVVRRPRFKPVISVMSGSLRDPRPSQARSTGRGPHSYVPA